MNTPSSTTRNMLSHPQFFKLCVWLATASLNGLTPEMATAHASDAMGFRVTIKNLKSARDATGVEFYLKGERVEAQSWERLLATELVNLLTKLNEPISPALRQLAGGKD